MQGRRQEKGFVITEEFVIIFISRLYIPLPWMISRAEISLFRKGLEFSDGYDDRFIIYRGDSTHWMTSIALSKEIFFQVKNVISEYVSLNSIVRYINVDCTFLEFFISCYYKNCII